MKFGNVWNDASDRFFVDFSEADALARHDADEEHAVLVKGDDWPRVALDILPINKTYGVSFLNEGLEVNSASRDLSGSLNFGSERVRCYRFEF